MLGAARDLEMAPTTLGALAVHRRTAMWTGRLQGAHDEAQCHRVDLDGDALRPVEGLPVDLPLGRACLWVERNFVGPELARFVDRDERRLHQVAERAAFRRHARNWQALVQGADARPAQHPVEDHPRREVADDQADPPVGDVVGVAVVALAGHLSGDACAWPGGGSSIRGAGWPIFLWKTSRPAGIAICRRWHSVSKRRRCGTSRGSQRNDPGPAVTVSSPHVQEILPWSRYQPSSSLWWTWSGVCPAGVLKSSRPSAPPVLSPLALIVISTWRYQSGSPPSESRAKNSFDIRPPPPYQARAA